MPGQADNAMFRSRIARLAGIADKGLRQCRITPEAIKALQEYHWPGNVREGALKARDRSRRAPL